MIVNIKYVPSARPNFLSVCGVNARFAKLKGG
jgi:hypothetical protein